MGHGSRFSLGLIFFASLLLHSALACAATEPSEPLVEHTNFEQVLRLAFKRKKRFCETIDEKSTSCKEILIRKQDGTIFTVQMFTKSETTDVYLPIYMSPGSDYKRLIKSEDCYFFSEQTRWHIAVNEETALYEFTKIES